MSDRGGYRYQDKHPVTGAPWPTMPSSLLNIWKVLQPDAPTPEACLVNHYRSKARMGLHFDADETDRTTGLITISLGASARFRLGGPTKASPTQGFQLDSGDVLIMAGASRNHVHGVDRILPAGDLFAPELPFDGRISLTLRRVSRAD